MHKRFMKLIVGGTLAVVVTLIVAGTASARIPIPPPPSHEDVTSTTSNLLGYPRGVVGAPGLETGSSAPVTHQAQKFASSYGDFPEVVRTMSLGTAAKTTSSSGFDWNDTGIGIGVAIAVVSIIGLAVFGIRRSKATPATA